MKENFERCLAIILQQEGSFSNHAWDNGGATNYGITIKTLTVWRNRTTTPADVQALTMQEAAAIYRSYYWDAMKCDALPSGFDLCAFNAAVNMGAPAASKLLQELLKVPVDGIIGQQTLFAVKYADTVNLIAMYHARMVKYYASLPDYPVAGKGWITRLFTITLKARA